MVNKSSLECDLIIAVYLYLFNTYSIFLGNYPADRCSFLEGGDPNCSWLYTWLCHGCIEAGAEGTNRLSLLRLLRLEYWELERRRERAKRCALSIRLVGGDKF